MAYYIYLWTLKAAIVEHTDEKVRRRADFLEKKMLRRQAEAKSTVEIIEHARGIFRSEASKDFFRKLAQEQNKTD